VPFAEQGDRGYGFSTWLGYVVRLTTPEPIVKKLEEEFIKAVRNPEVAAKLKSLGADPVGSTAEELKRMISQEGMQWRTVLSENGIKLEE
jgi:tripartite-type tricarboxylate transporter receptor subunit TctC